VIAFHGEMGAGKTTFIHSICRALQVQNTVSSPTFSIINEYLLPAGRIIYHMDLYRLKDESEAIEAGVEDCLHSGKVCLVEWPDKAPGLFSPGTLHCHFHLLTDNQRKLQINL
jgi:tRNA threonylcarbamoyladenosine biosynthesis protein TsaE